MNEPLQLPDLVATAPDPAEEAARAALDALRAAGCPSLIFTVPGRARPAGSKKGFGVPGKKIAPARGLRPRTVLVVNHHGYPTFGHIAITDDTKTLKPWQETVKAHAPTLTDGPLTGAVAIHFRVELGRPRSHYRTGKSTGHLLTSSAPARPTMKPDTLKLARGIEDALTGQIYHDDALIVWELIEKVYADVEQVVITVFDLGPSRHR